MPTGQQYATNVPQTTLTGSINASATSVSVASSASWPSVPFTAVFDIGTSTQEPVDVTAVVGTTWTVTRNIDSTIGFSHAIGATVTHADIGRDFREARSHMDASTAVHGVLASVVGTTNVQTLTNKTLTSPIINTPTLSGSGGTLSLPAGPDTLVGRATTDTLTNKTLTAPTINTASFAGTPTGTLSGSALTLGGASVIFAGLTGATYASSRMAGSTVSGPPASGTFTVGDMVRDASYNALWVCTSGGTPGTWVLLGGRALLSTAILGSSGTFSFTGIPSWVNHLEVYYQARGVGGTTGGIFAEGHLNLDSGNNYTWEVAFGQITTTTASNSAGAVSQFRASVLPSNGDSANHFGNGFLTVRNIQQTSQFKPISGYGGGASSTTSAASGTFSGLWLSTAAVTGIQLFGAGGTNLATGSSWQVYGLV